MDVGPDKWLEWGEFNIFAESGYDLSVLDFDAQILADDARSLSIDKNIKHDVGTVQVGLLLRKYGGVFLSKSTFLRSELAVNLESGYSVDNNGNIAMMISEQDSIDVLKSPSSSSKVLRLKAIPQAQDQDKTITKINEWGIAILSSDDSRSCMEDLSWELEPSGVVAVTVDHSSLAEHVIHIDSECYRLVEEKCIYCDEIHWEFPQED